MKTRIIYAWKRIRLFKDWYKTIPPLKRFYKDVYRLHLRSGVKVWVRGPGDDVRILVQMFQENAYPIQQLKLPEYATVLDLGANIGAFGLAVKWHFLTADITSYEMDARNCVVLRWNRAKCFNLAITGETSIVTYYENNHFISTTLFKDRLNKKVINPVERQVHSIAFSELLTGKIDLVKMDIEGAEYDAIMKCPVERLARISNLFLEIHDTSWVAEIQKKMLDAGFVVKWADNLTYWFTKEFEVFGL